MTRVKFSTKQKLFLRIFAFPFICIIHILRIHNSLRIHSNFFCLYAKLNSIRLHSNNSIPKATGKKFHVNVKNLIKNFMTRCCCCYCCCCYICSTKKQILYCRFFYFCAKKRETATTSRRSREAAKEPQKLLWQTQLRLPQEQPREAKTFLM